MRGKILIVEDDVAFGIMLQKWFERNGYSPVWQQTMSAAQAALSESKFDVVLCDLRLPDGDGISLLGWLNDRQLSIPVIIMTGYGEVQTAVSAIKLGAFDFLEKPINPIISALPLERVSSVAKFW